MEIKNLTWIAISARKRFLKQTPAFAFICLVLIENLKGSKAPVQQKPMYFRVRLNFGRKEAILERKVSSQTMQKIRVKGSGADLDVFGIREISNFSIRIGIEIERECKVSEEVTE